MKLGTSIDQWLKPLAVCGNQAYLTNTLQVADVLEWILQQVGTATVWQTSFSISEEFLRRLFFIEKSGRVKEFNLVLDHKATNKTLSCGRSSTRSSSAPTSPTTTARSCSSWERTG